MICNGQSEVGQIESILLKHPRDAFQSQSLIESQWQKLNYTSPPDFERALDEYEAFLELLREDSLELHFLPADESTGLDSIYLHDPIVITKRGAILCRMGKQERADEPEACGRYLKSIDVPLLGAVTGDGRLEGGDVVWLDERTVAVGQGYRTNAEGIRQLRRMLGDLVDVFIVVPLPHWEGPSDVLHLMSMISPVGERMALVYSRLLSVPFRQWLVEREFELIEVPDEEYSTMACNVLTVRPGVCIMLTGNPHTKKKLETQGIEVREYTGDEISVKGAGGPTCLTRPLRRKV